VEAVWEEEVKLRGVGFVKEVGFKPWTSTPQHRRGCFATTYLGPLSLDLQSLMRSSVEASEYSL